ncbi:MAG: carboxypeptidase regulatory-like domain-containing protein [Acidobacteriota bacterium]
MGCKGYRAFFSAFAFLLILGTSASQAQTANGRIAGLVTDPAGAVVPGVEVTTINEETGVSYLALTDDVGRYTFVLLPPGRYRLSAALPGFRTYDRRGLVLGTGEHLSVDFRLELGEMSEVVTVTESASLLETNTSDISQLIESKNVSDLPLNGRRALSLAAVVPATVWVSYSGNAKPNFSLAGGRTQSQVIWIDGGNGQNMRLGVGQIDSDPPVEVVREFRILTNAYSAEFGGSAGGVIIMTTKSGTNEFHGSLFEYFRNDALDAANFFAPIDAETGEKLKAPLRYNLFGGTVGGPIFKNKTHFFFGYEATRQRDGRTDILTVPTELQRQGDFSQTFNAAGKLIRIFDPASTRTEEGKTVRNQFPGNRIPIDRLDPVALKILNFYPAPNRPASNAAGASNFAGNWTEAFDRDNITARVDHVINDDHRVYGRYIYNEDPIISGSVMPDPRTDTRNSRDRYQHNMLVAYNNSFSPSWLNDLRYTYGYRIFHNRSAGLGGTWDQELGLDGISGEAFPRINVASMSPLGSGGHERRQFPIWQHQIVESMTLLLSRHTLRFGAEIRQSNNNEVNRPSISGNFSFGVQPTALPGTGGTGFGFASFLMGFPNSFTIRETEVLNRYSYYLATYVQDDWKLHPNLTLNLGLRWEADTPMTDRNSRMNGFDPVAINPVSGTPGVVRFAGVNGWPINIADPDWNNFGPRIGLAWRPFGQGDTVIRAGAGIFYAHPFDHGAPASAALGFEKSANLQTPDNGITAPFLLKDGVPPVQLAGNTLDDSFGAVPVGKGTTTAVSFYDRNRQTGYSQQFNLTIQHEIKGMLFEAGYLGNLSRKLANSNLSINQIVPEKLGPGVTQKDRPFPQFSNVIIQFPSLGVINYHAGFFKVERRFAGGLSFLTNYTWAKNIGNSDPGGGGLGDVQFYQDFYNRKVDRGPGELDINHRFIWSSVYELPFGQRRRWLSGSPLSHALGGWSFGAITSIQSGPPFSLWTQTNTTRAFSSGAQRVNLLRDPSLPSSERSIERWFDTDAVAAPEEFTFGNSGNGILRADGQINFDFSMIKNLYISEDKFVQIRGEMFNAFNHPNFGIPGHALGGPGFGIINSASAGRIIQFGLRAVF